MTTAIEAATQSFFIGHLFFATPSPGRRMAPAGSADGVTRERSVIRIAVLLKLWPIVHPRLAGVKGPGGRLGSWRQSRRPSWR
jgi:hypothetical protein